MKKVILLSAITLAVLTTVGSALQSKRESSLFTESPPTIEKEQTPQPRLYISPTTQDLGTVTYGEVAETNFTLSNDTDQIVQITRVSTSCGCTKAFPEKEVLEPGKSINIKVTFDPAVHKDDSDLGEITRTIYIETNHSEFKRLESIITATVVKP